MPTRLYTLAKDLKIDSKELVDLCTKAGIPGKGSALASLEDDEVAKLKVFLESATTKRAAQLAPAPLVDTKAVLSSPVAGTATLPPPPPPRNTPLRSRPAAAPSVAPTVVAPSPPSPVEAPPAVAAKIAEPPPAPPVSPAPRTPASRPPSTPASKPAASPPAPAELGPQRGDSLIPRRPIKVIDTKTKRPAEKRGDARSADRERRGPRFAEMPDVKQPTPGTRSGEPKAQKPVIKLPTDVIKKGTKAPLHDLTARLEKERKSKIDGDKKKGESQTGVLAKPGKGKKGRGGEFEGLGDMASVRADRQKARKARGKGFESDDDGTPARRRKTLVRVKSHGSTAAPRKGKAVVQLPSTVRTFCESAGVPFGAVQKTLMGLGMANPTINASIPEEYVELVASELGLELEFRQPQSLEEKIRAMFESPDDEATLRPRSPIVTVLGHVDHGKTSLLDKIIGTNVVAGEAGGITQHIRAYSIPTKDGRHVTFVDTPGHEAFTEMRARGANVTDVAILVVAANDGVMPQTEEAISHAKAAGVPIVVAMNKVDLPGLDQQRVLQQLATAGLLPSEWGGDIEVVRTSAITGEGIDTLLETLLVTAELHELKANPNRPAAGMCLEAEQQAGRGVMAKLMVQNGTLKEGDIVVCGAGYGRVKAMYDALRPRQRIKEAGPAIPVNVSGLDTAPQAGERFYVLDDITQARELAAQRELESRQQSLAGITKKVSFDEFQQRLSEGRLGAQDEVATLYLIIRADVRGSIEAILKELGKLDHPEVKVKVLQASVGGVTVGDVTLASASGAVIVAFNVIPDETARALAEERQVEIRRYDIIYKVTDDIRAILEGKLKPELQTIELGAALVKQAFSISRVGTVAGCQVIRGSIERGCRIRVNRDSRTIGDYAIDSLKRGKDDAKEVARGMECGIKLANYNDVKEGDILEAYKVQEVARTL
ncbi:MAG TPA: translation initiation factor IF-2 [Pirellulaceae bacterium]|nr:translation initiation factor IF-2 [Pirellulaceae bacterium]